VALARESLVEDGAGGVGGPDLLPVVLQLLGGRRVQPHGHVRAFLVVVLRELGKVLLLGRLLPQLRRLLLRDAGDRVLTSLRCIERPLPPLLGGEAPAVLRRPARAAERAPGARAAPARLGLATDDRRLRGPARARPLVLLGLEPPGVLLVVPGGVPGGGGTRAAAAAHLLGAAPSARARWGEGPGVRQARARRAALPYGTACAA